MAKPHATIQIADAPKIAVDNVEFTFVDKPATRRSGSNPHRSEYVSSNRVRAQRLYWLEYPRKSTPQRRPPHPTPPISNAIRQRVAKTHPRRRHNGAFWMEEFAERRRKRQERLHPSNDLVKAATGIVQAAAALARRIAA